MLKPASALSTHYQYNWSHRIHLDLPLLFGLLLLCSFGLFVLYSASEQNMGLIQRQLTHLGVAFVGMIILAQIPPSYLRLVSPWFFLVGVILLVLVLAVGSTSKGAQRWLDIGILRFQPSEVVKILMPMMIAWYLSASVLPPNWKRLLISAVLILVPTLLIAKQPDLGTSILVASAGVFVVFLAGINWWIIASLLGSLVVAIPLAFRYVLHEYQRDRIRTLLDPEKDPLGTGYHIIQSKIAIGSGGLYGKGWFNGTQSHLEFLPERTTDFIFAVLGEELGFFGILALLAIYLWIVIRGLMIANQAQDNYGRLLAGSLILVFFVYLFVNTGMVSGILPVVGVPLPLVSYGGTSLVTIFAIFGILMSIHTHRRPAQQTI